MKYRASINIMPLKELLDPQGKAVNNVLKNKGWNTIDDIRIGKHIQIDLDAANEDEAKQIATKACEDLLCNRVMESYSIQLTAL